MEYEKSDYTRNGGVALNPVAAQQPIAAQPVGYNPTIAAPPGQPIYAQNAFAAPNPTVVQASAAVPARNGPVGQVQYTPRPQPGRWRDSIFDCCNNLFPSCWCACCCCYGMYLNAQMAHKVGLMQFNSTILTVCIIWFISIILQLVLGASILFWLPLLFSFIFGIVLRLRVVSRYNITECGTSPCLGEFCCAFWCWYCSVAQMARHVYGYTKPLDGDGDPDRPDNYGPENL